MRKFTAELEREDVAVVERLEEVSDTIRRQAAQMGKREVRYLVDTYYQIQDRRKASSNQERSIREADEPSSLSGFLVGLDTFAEDKIRLMLQAYAEGNKDASWAMSIIGIGPVISAGLAAHIDITKAPTVGHIWRFAGIDPSQQWKGSKVAGELVASHLGGRKPTSEDVYALAEKMQGLRAESVLRLATTKKDGTSTKLTATTLKNALAVRPFDAGLKVLCWKIGESFVKVKNHKDDIYGKLYDVRKRLEEERNEAGLFKSQAEQKLEKYKIGKETDAYKFYSKGMLPPAHIHSRAKRYAVKIFLAHYHHVAYEVAFGEAPPKPYIIEIKGHAHYMRPPNWPM